MATSHITWNPNLELIAAVERKMQKDGSLDESVSVLQGKTIQEMISVLEYDADDEVCRGAIAYLKQNFNVSDAIEPYKPTLRQIIEQAKEGTPLGVAHYMCWYFSPPPREE